MKIAFESQLLLKGNKTGIGWCADNLIKGLAQIPEYECELNYFARGVSEEKQNTLEEYKALGIQTNPCKFFKDTWHKFLWPFLPIPYSCFFGSDQKITQFFNYVVPPGVKGKKVTFVHDMAHMACRDTVRLKTRKWLDLTLKSSCRRADVIITISSFSKQEIIEYLNIDPGKIKVMMPGVNLNLFHDRYTPKQIAGVRGKYGVRESYILYTGTIEPRKNLKRLIEAYELLIKQNRSQSLPQLVLAGGKGWLCNEIYEAAQKEELKGHILFTGYVDEMDLPLLMSGAKFFCFPSLYEGFGMPPIEAMACGTPVLAANVSSLPEVLGDCAVYVDPYSMEDIARGLEELLSDDVLRERLGFDGLEFAKRYDWKYSVETVEKIYCELMEK